MADTGAPFFLPYPLDTDLVRDGASDIEALAEAVALALENIPVTEKRIEAFTGSGNWTVPAGVTYAIAHMLGGGGALGHRDESVPNGGSSSVAFTSGTVVSLGGAGFQTNGTSITQGTNGVANTGRGGNGVSAAGTSGAEVSNSMASEWNVAGAEVTPSSTIAVVVGAGGIASRNGGSGYVYIEYYEEV